MIGKHAIRRTIFRLLDFSLIDESDWLVGISRSGQNLISLGMRRAYQDDASIEQSGGAPGYTIQRRFMTHCFAASSSPAEKCLISADTKCDAKFSATLPIAESVTRPIFLMRLW